MDDGRSDKTTCDKCGRSAPWRETARWAISSQRCFCSRCWWEGSATGSYDYRSKKRNPEWTDRRYHGRLPEEVMQ